MNRYLRWMLCAVPWLVVGCASPPPAVNPVTPPSRQNTQLEFALKSGNYRCEQNVRIKVEREVRQGKNAILTIEWEGRSHRLERNPSSSGLPRFETATGDFVWIDLPWKSVLLDGKTNTPLVSECRPV